MKSDLDRAWSVVRSLRGLQMTVVGNTLEVHGGGAGNWLALPGEAEAARALAATPDVIQNLIEDLVEFEARYKKDLGYWRTVWADLQVATDVATRSESSFAYVEYERDEINRSLVEAQTRIAELEITLDELRRKCDGK